MNTNRRKEKTLPKIDPNAVLGVYGMVPPRAIEVEAAVLGGILLEKRAIEDVIGLLPGKEVFYETAHQHVWEAIEQLYRDNQPIDLMTVVDRLIKSKKLDEVGGPYGVTKLTMSVVTSANIQAHCHILLQKWMKREIGTLGSQMVSMSYDDGLDDLEAVSLAEKRLMEIMSPLHKRTYTGMEGHIVEMMKRIENARANPDILLGVPSGYTALDNITKGWRGSDLIILAARPSVGKCLGRGTKIIMYDGSLKKVEDVLPGDLLMGDDSTARKVLSTTSGKEMMYIINQKKGISYRVNESHILSVMCSRNENGRKHGDKLDIPLTEYLSKSKKFQNNWKGYKVPIEFNDQDVEIPPYLLGIWLGDGSINKPEVTKPDNEIYEYMVNYAESQNLKLRVNYNKTSCRSYALVGKNRKRGEPNFIEKLRNIGVLSQKHIPREYLINSTQKRMELLAGLLDTDGYLIPTGCYEITQKNEQLIKDIKFLCDTLGLRTVFKEKKGSIKSINFSGKYFKLIISGNIGDIPVRIERKKWHKKTRSRDHRINGIEIKKDVEDEYFGFTLDGNGRFLLEDCTVTHNTAFAINLARNAATNHFKPTKVGILSLEMSAGQLVERLVSAETEIWLEKIVTGRMEDSTMKQLYDKATKSIAKMPIVIDDTASLNIFEAKSKIRKMVRDGVGLVIIDYLQLMSGLTSDRGQNREQEVSTISRNLKIIAKELNIPIIALSQLSRDVEKRKEGNKVPVLADLRESGGIEQDADLVMFLYRPEYHDIMSNEMGESTRGQTMLKIAKHRNGVLETINFQAQLHIQKFIPAEPGVHQPRSASNVAGTNWAPIRKINEDFDDSPF